MSDISRSRASLAGPEDGTPPPAKKAPAKKALAKKALAKKAPAKKAPAKKAPAKKAAPVAPLASDASTHPDRSTADDVPTIERGRREKLKGWRPRPPGAVTQTVVGVLLLALVVFLAWSNHRRSASDEAGAAAAKVVVPHVAELLSYTPTSVLADLPKERKWLTGDFAGNYELLVTQRIAPAAQSGGVDVVATVTASGVGDATADRVELLLFVNTQTTSTQDKTPAVAGSRVSVTAEKVDGQWRISDLAPV